MKVDCFQMEPAHSTPIEVISVEEYPLWAETQSPKIRNWLEATQFKPKPYAHAMLPSSVGTLEKVLLICDQEAYLWSAGKCPLALPSQVYHFQNVGDDQLQSLLIGWGLGAYQFTRYKSPEQEAAKCIIGECMNQVFVHDVVSAIEFVRDLINTPAEDMHPECLASEAQELALAYHADFKQVVGDDLLHNNYPAIHAVGRAGSKPPRLIDITWGEEIHPKVTLVGKGVCFDSGGLDLKSASNMALMKKDMGGAANVLGLAQLVMASELPIRLRVLIPAVENSVSSQSYRPGDVINTRKGITVEVGNTDAEGRLVLADALALAAEEQPDVIIDMATLTGAARVAMGTELPALFSNSDNIADGIIQSGFQNHDPLWRMPLYQPYKTLLDSKIAECNNVTNSFYGEAITAALFLEQFVKEIPWVHIDMMAWNVRTLPGRPEGGDAMGLRACFEYIRQCCSQ